MSDKEDDLFLQLQEKNHKNKQSSETEIEKEIRQEAEQIEQKNHSQIKKSRIKLQGMEIKNKNLTEKLKKQGEKISKAKKTSYNVQDKAEKAEDLADEIERESRWCNFSCWSFCSTIFHSNKNSKSPMSNINSEKNKHIQKEPSESESETDYSDSDSNNVEYLKGEHKTNSELKIMLKTIRNIKKESTSQASLIKMQKNDLSELQSTNERTKNKVKSTNKFLDSEKNS